LLINIKKSFIHYEILILLSLTENLYNENLLKFDYVKCVTIRKQHISMWGNIELFNEYNTNKLYENSTFKNYVMEELFISTYLVKIILLIILYI
jgi:hypothetical protein